MITNYDYFVPHVIIINPILNTALCQNFIAIGSKLLELHPFKIRRVTWDTLYNAIARL